MYLKIRGLVLRITDYNDRDALITLLIEDRGRITVKARGLRRKNSPLAAPCQLLSFGEFMVFEYKDSFTINEAHTITLFEGLRKDLQKLALGTYFAQVAELISQEDLPSPALLSLTLNCLYALSEFSVDEKQVKSVFELKCACLAGYEPNLAACHICGNQLADRFHLSDGVLECVGCRNALDNGIRLPVDNGTVDAMRYITSCDRKVLFRFRVSESTLQQLSQITESYLVTQLEKGFSALDFYKTLLI